MAISSNPKPTIYHNLYENTDPGQPEWCSKVNGLLTKLGMARQCSDQCPDQRIMYRPILIRQIVHKFPSPFNVNIMSVHSCVVFCSLKSLRNGATSIRWSVESRLASYLFIGITHYYINEKPYLLAEMR